MVATNRQKWRSAISALPTNAYEEDLVNNKDYS